MHTPYVLLSTRHHRLTTLSSASGVFGADQPSTTDSATVEAMLLERQSDSPKLHSPIIDWVLKDYQYPWSTREEDSRVMARLQEASDLVERRRSQGRAFGQELSECVPASLTLAVSMMPF